MSPGGFAGRVLNVDLGRRAVDVKALDLALAEKFLGGLGLCVKLAAEAVTPGVHPLSPENTIVIGAGALVGTSVPAASRVYALTKLPASGAVGWCGGGGMRFGCALKDSGFDAVVITGKADHPVYLHISDMRVEICDARFLKGSGVSAAAESLWKLHGTDAGVITIGQAAENGVAFSMAFIDRLSTLGRGGFGAVMGSKNLKAIVCKGTGGIGVSDRPAYSAHLKSLMGEIREYPYLEQWQELGLLKSLPAIPREAYLKIKKRRLACVSCPIGDKDAIVLADGKHKGLAACSSSVVNMLTPMIYGFSDYRESIKCAAALDELGLDIFEFFSLMSFAKSLASEGLIPAEYGSPPIDLTSRDSMEEWAMMISLRKGLGDALAGGTEGLLRALGKEAKPPAVVKGMLPYVGPGAPLPWDLMGSMELGQLLDPRGPHVGASGSPTYFARRPLEAFPRHLARMGVPESAIPRILVKGDGGQGLAVGRLLRYSHRWFSILGSLGICARAQINRFYSASRCAELYRAVTGFPADVHSLALGADRAWTLLRMINVREGFERKNDSPPEAWFGKQPFKDYCTGEPLDRAALDRMIDDYYDEQGWDIKRGIPTGKRLEELGLEEAL